MQRLIALIITLISVSSVSAHGYHVTTHLHVMDYALWILMPAVLLVIYAVKRSRQPQAARINKRTNDQR